MKNLIISTCFKSSGGVCKVQNCLLHLRIMKTALRIWCIVRQALNTNRSVGRCCRCLLRLYSVLSLKSIRISPAIFPFSSPSCNKFNSCRNVFIVLNFVDEITISSNSSVLIEKNSIGSMLLGNQRCLFCFITYITKFNYLLSVWNIG